jgi:hypothetical protein
MNDGLNPTLSAIFLKPWNHCNKDIVLPVCFLYYVGTLKRTVISAQ